MAFHHSLTFAPTHSHALSHTNTEHIKHQEDGFQVQNTLSVAISKLKVWAALMGCLMQFDIILLTPKCALLPINRPSPIVNSKLPSYGYKVHAGVP